MPSNEEISNCIIKLAQERGSRNTICPSDVARKLNAGNWRSLMSEIREIAAKLADDGQIKVTRAGQDVDPLQPQAPIRIGLSSHRPRIRRM